MGLDRFQRWWHGTGGQYWTAGQSTPAPINDVCTQGQRPSGDTVRCACRSVHPLRQGVPAREPAQFTHLPTTPMLPSCRATYPTALSYRTYPLPLGVQEARQMAVLRERDMRAAGCRDYCRRSAKLHFFNTSPVFAGIEFGIRGYYDTVIGFGLLSLQQLRDTPLTVHFTSSSFNCVSSKIWCAAFLPRDAMLARYMPSSYVCALCGSATPGIVSKRPRITQTTPHDSLGTHGSVDKYLREVQTESCPTGAPNAGGVG